MKQTLNDMAQYAKVPAEQVLIPREELRSWITRIQDYMEACQTECNKRADYDLAKAYAANPPNLYVEGRALGLQEAITVFMPNLDSRVRR